MSDTVTNGDASRRRHGRVVVVYGGRSAEREVSLLSGGAVLASLVRSGVDAHGFDFAGGGLSGLEALAPDRVFIAMHGRDGEDGSLQGALELLGIPYTGSGVLASALGMDKERTKQLWRAHGLPTPESVMLEGEPDWDAVIEALGLPLIVKPVHEGSTIGISIVETRDALIAAHAEASRFDSAIMAERFVQGEEYTVSLLGDEVLPAIRVEVPSGFYDYEAKYHSDTTRYLLPCGLEQEEERMLGDVCRRAFEAIGGRGWGRVDVMRDAQGRFWLLEVNTVPGMTDHSLVPQAAAHAGLDFDALVLRILDTTTGS
ncbi:MULTISPECIES: D-alanine--D-alanine ligase [Chromohalobacter]|uniref:D-alanine--D-alanine ligase n=1 Tax=Chromohalobacter TaxID=42054 RepID=UPI00054E529E|nr:MULTISPECIES: D-alanine--D-alanine ligase [Chromohalobacter]MDF9433496.1 D-alanine--D-alanine ligase [Chromohalobacter israelensis]MDO0946316.1 D-alanine--D-alanine ligase [Chromohalobacter salexigens]NQY46112.1 D-alanine--D-alanine ligase [Chromohalobacter sp.]NWO56940.1 D-alanine--D-alanine ligase [Chromohalobacter salexigens]PWW41871.1 D-alanine--D-alanine ligase [Chromohalobacter salexigens]